MQRESSRPILSTVFVDYDNVYLSLKRKSEEAAKRFSKEAGLWIREIESGRLMTPTNGPSLPTERRIVMNRCYGNPVPRRNTHDNSTDMSSFPFVRHHFLRAGFEVIDCPPLTAQLKNSADIRMVMDVRDILNHDTYYDEFIILSGDADFTPVLHRLRAHARRTVIYSNDHTAAPYTAICDAEIREADFLTLLLEGHLPDKSGASTPSETRALPSAETIESLRKEILDEVVATVRAAAQPVPLEALADRAVRALGHDKTVGSGWGGVGSFRDMLAKGLPDEIRLNDQPPYCVYDAGRSMQEQAKPLESHRPQETAFGRAEPREALAPFQSGAQPMQRAPVPPAGPPAQTERAAPAPAQPDALSGQPGLSRPPPYGGATGPTGNAASAIQESIARIHEACQAPTLSPPDYRTLFDVMAQEIGANGLAGAQTLANIVKRAQELSIDVRRDDVRFVLDVVSEADPWFDQGASASLFASRFRNFVVARCRSQGLNLSAEELDLIEAWFAGPPGPQQQRSIAAPPQAAARPAPAPQPVAMTQGSDIGSDRWWTGDEERQQVPASGVMETDEAEDEFPRIIRTRLRG